MNQFQLKDLKGRNLFFNTYPNSFTKVVAMADDYSQHDLEATGQTAQVYAIEIKVRKNSSEDYNSTTLLELHKLEHFQSILKNEPSRICLYSVFFNNGICITYNISERIKEALQPGQRWKLNTYQQKFQNNDTNSSEQKVKNVLDLKFNPTTYGDRKKKYIFN